MYVETVEVGDRGSGEARGAPAGRFRRRWRGPTLDRFELGVLAAFAAVSVWVLGIDLFRVIAEGKIWTGTDGLFLTDQMQYVAWIQSASHQLLISDLFLVHGSAPDYLQPLVVLSAVLTRAGVAASLSLLLWKPVAVLAIFFAVRAFAGATLTSRGQQRAALIIGLFGGGLPAIGDIWPGFWSWGYSFPLIGIAALPAALVCYGRARDRGGAVWPAAALGALASWLHPWQGETLILIVLGSELVLWVRGGRGRPARSHIKLALLTVSVGLLPLLYYSVLSHFDRHWGMAQVASKHMVDPIPVALSLAPLLAASLLAYRRRPEDFMALATRLWLPVTIVVFVVSESGLSATPLHAFAGITIPLGVLSVEGLARVLRSPLRTHPALAAALIAVVTIPTAVDELKSAMRYISPSLHNGNFIARDERAALDYLAANRQPGGVLARSYLGLLRLR